MRLAAVFFGSLAAPAAAAVVRCSDYQRVPKIHGAAFLELWWSADQQVIESEQLLAVVLRVQDASTADDDD